MRLLTEVIERRRFTTKVVLSCRNCTRFKDKCREAWLRYGQRGNWHKVCWLYEALDKEIESEEK